MQQCPVCPVRSLGEQSSCYCWDVGEEQGIQALGEQSATSQNHGLVSSKSSSSSELELQSSYGCT